MKVLRWLLALSFLSLSASAQQRMIKQDPLDFPSQGSSNRQYTFDELKRESDKLDPKVGSWPPRLRDERERRRVYQQWSGLVLAAERLRESEQDSERILCLLANLYRQGHNMEVREAGQKTDDTLQLALRLYPESVPVHFQASYAYLQFDPKFAPQGEASLFKLRELLGTDRNKEVERGLLFAYLNQRKSDDARRQVEHCLTIDPRDEFFLAVREALKDGGQIEEKRVK